MVFRVKCPLHFLVVQESWEALGRMLLGQPRDQCSVKLDPVRLNQAPSSL